MKVFRTVSNQWAVGFGLRRSTIIGERRWMLWWNAGYRSASLCWGLNQQIRND